MKTIYIGVLWVVFIIFLSIFFKINSETMEKKWKINTANLSEAIFAGGCFWCMEWIFEAQEWVFQAIAWYASWNEKTANYKDVSTGKTDHKESVKVFYDPNIISYTTLVKLFWTQIDPTNPNWQFADIGPQYQTAIFYKNNDEKKIAEISKQKLWDSKKFEKPIATQILPFTTFFPAEEYHQDYYKKNSLHYKSYKKWSGRADFIEKNWNEKEKQKTNLQYIDYDENIIKTYSWRILLFFHAERCSSCNNIEKQILHAKLPTDLLILKIDFDSQKDLTQKYLILTQSSFVQIDNNGNVYKRIIWWSNWDDIVLKLVSKEEILKQKLTPLEFTVTQIWGTEKPFENKYWDNHEKWIYVDIVDGMALFSSTDKFDSGTGWPSFSKPIDDTMIWKNNDTKLWMARTEVVGKTSSSHLWHVFHDWPSDLGWMRYCINSAALKFIPLKDMKKMWYEKYLFLFEINK